MVEELGNKKRTPPPITSGWINYPGTAREFEEASRIRQEEQKEEQKQEKLDILKQIRTFPEYDWETLTRDPKIRDKIISGIAEILKSKIGSVDLVKMAHDHATEEEKALKALEKGEEISGSPIPARILYLHKQICVILQVNLSFEVYKRLSAAALNVLVK